VTIRGREVEIGGDEPPRDRKAEAATWERIAERNERERRERRSREQENGERRSRFIEARMSEDEVTMRSEGGEEEKSGDRGKEEKGGKKRRWSSAFCLLQRE
jgi:hypothetical protein